LAVTCYSVWVGILHLTCCI